MWCPFAIEDVIKRELLEFPTTEFMRWREDHEEAHEIQPPTYFKNNDVTSTPQLITNTYGVPSYQEANPACFSVVTFPFLFAVMFGDYGHGSLILFAGLNMVLWKSYLEKYLPAEILKHRYIFMMMGMFSCYNGLLYNEWFAIPFPWFNSCYETGQLPTADMGYVFPYVDFPGQEQTTDVYNTTCVYPFGMDPTWFLAENDILTVQNSMKMKISVIIAVLHMSMGIVTKGLNAVYFKEKVVLYFEVVTGMIILNGLFGWMDFLIIYKWFYKMNPYSSAPDMVARINAAPSIITIMINNFLAGGNQPFSNSTFSGNIFLFPAQQGISEFLVILVLICVPLMLFVKPCSLMYCPEFAGLEDIREHNEAVRTEDSQNPNGEEALLANQEANTTSQLQLRLDEYQELLDQEKEGNEGHSINEAFIH